MARDSVPRYGKKGGGGGREGGRDGGEGGGDGLPAGRERKKNVIEFREGQCKGEPMGKHWLQGRASWLETPYRDTERRGEGEGGREGGTEGREGETVCRQDGKEKKM